MVRAGNAAPLTREQVRGCRAAIREGSKSFYLASLVLPPRVRVAASALYAFCRLSDDLADDPEATSGTTERLKRRLSAAYRGAPSPHPSDQALAKVVAQYEIPQEVLFSMIEGFEWDLSGRSYETLSELIEYSARVAGTVGVMMTIVMQRRSARTLARACDLGVAMQLTNIARDVGEDAASGRLYLPRQWMREEGLDPGEFLKKPVFSEALARVVERLLCEADRIYARSRTGIADLPFACRPGIRAAGLVYAEIGAQIRRNGFDSVNRRAYTASSRKLFLLGRAMFGQLGLDHCDESPAMKETAYLVRAASVSCPETKGTAEWLLDLYAQLNQRDRVLSCRNEE